LCVAPDARGRGIGSALLQSAQEKTPGPLRVWAHGDLPVAQRLASTLGYTAVRELRLMQLDLDGSEIEVSKPPEGVEIRTFRPGVDNTAWLEVNAEAFAHHPEQGSLTERSLAERIAEPWFDPAGFFLAWRDGRLIGSHWTKTHPRGAYSFGPSGEIYVLGVRPGAEGHGLGRLLARTGLRYLAAKGLDTVVLYVEGDNAAAVHLYESLGFRTRSADKMYESRESG
jgi:mycothiol synthase